MPDVDTNVGRAQGVLAGDLGGELGEGARAGETSPDHAAACRQPVHLIPLRQTGEDLVGDRTRERVG